MDLQKVKTIIHKEWAEVFKNRMVLFSVIFMPLIFTALPLIILYATRDAGLSELDTEMPAQFAQLCSEELTGGECFQVYMTSQMMLLFMMMPLIIPVNIAAYSIVGEKTTHSLEPLLATPITTGELVTGKNLSAVIPAVIATWAAFGLFALGAVILIPSGALLRALFDSMWLVAIFLLGPLLAVLSVNFSIMVSSRVNDPRVAEQMSTVVIVPLMAMFLGQIAGLFFVNTSLILWTALVTLFLDVIVLYLAVKLFQRETILTRWK